MKRLRTLMYSLLLASTLLSASTPVQGAGGQLSSREHVVLERVYNLMCKEEYRKSLEILSPLLQKKKPSSYAFSYASICYANLGQSEKMMQLLQRAVAIYPVNHNFRYNLGISQLQSGNLEGAVTSLSSLIDPDKVQEQLRYNLAFAHYRLGRYDKGLEVLSPITAGDPVKKHWLRLEVYCHIGKNDWKRAERSALRLLGLTPDASDLWTLLGQISINAKNFARSSAYFEIARILFPEAAPLSSLEQLYGFQSAWNEQVRHQLQRGASPLQVASNLQVSCQYSQALKVLEQEPAGESMESMFLRGQLLYSLSRDNEALEALSSVERYPLSEERKPKESRRERDRITARARLLAGQILWLDHKWERARNIFKELELLPGYQQLGASLSGLMQSFLDEQKRREPQPGLYDPPLIIGRND